MSTLWLPQGSTKNIGPFLHKQRQWGWRCEAGYGMIAGQGEHFTYAGGAAM